MRPSSPSLFSNHRKTAKALQPRNTKCPAVMTPTLSIRRRRTGTALTTDARNSPSAEEDASDFESSAEVPPRPRPRTRLEKKQTRGTTALRDEPDVRQVNVGLTRHGRSIVQLSGGFTDGGGHPARCQIRMSLAVKPAPETFPHKRRWSSWRWASTCRHCRVLTPKEPRILLWFKATRHRPPHGRQPLRESLGAEPFIIIVQFPPPRVAAVLGPPGSAH